MKSTYFGMVVALASLAGAIVSALPVQNTDSEVLYPVERSDDILRFHQGLAVAMLRKLQQLKDSQSKVAPQSSHPLIPVSPPESDVAVENASSA